MYCTKNGVRNMKRWDTEIPALRAAHPDLTILSCHDEYLLHTIMDVDGLLVGYGNIAPELLLELIAAGKAQDWTAAKADPQPAAAGHPGRLPPRLAHGGHRLRSSRRWSPAASSTHATVRSPLLPLAPGAHHEIADALKGRPRAGQDPRARLSLELEGSRSCTGGPPFGSVHRDHMVMSPVVLARGTRGNG